MTGEVGILRCGVHIPRLRLARAKIAAAMAWLSPPSRTSPAGARAIGNWDEDALTLAVEAARRCLGAPPFPPPQAAIFCSTTAPFADRDDAGLAAAALDLPESTRTSNASGSLRAATSALVGELRAARTEPVLLLASDTRLARPGSAQEMSYGDAAAALLLGPSGPGTLATVLCAHGVSSDFVDHYRMSGQRFDYALEERWARDESLLKLLPRAIEDLLGRAQVRAQDVTHLALPVAGVSARRLAELTSLGHARRDATVLEHCGDAGVAQPFLLLLAALEASSPGDLIVLAGIGQGADVLLLRAEEGVRGLQALSTALASGREEPSYVRYLSHRHLLDVDFGMRAERDERTAHTVAWRKRDMVTAFKGGRCSRCGTVQFPRTRVCVNPECRATDTQTPHRLADSSGTVKTFTEDWQAYSVRPPCVYGNVQFAEGGNLLMEFTDLEAGELKVGDPVRFVFRIKDEDRTRAFRRYFWKATRTG